MGKEGGRQGGRKGGVGERHPCLVFMIRDGHTLFLTFWRSSAIFIQSPCDIYLYISTIIFLLKKESFYKVSSILMYNEYTMYSEHSKAPLFQAADWKNNTLKGNFKQQSSLILASISQEVLIPPKVYEHFASNNLKKPNSS